MKIVSEKMLGAALVEWLTSEGWNCFPEAQLRMRGPRADLLVVKRCLLWAIEIKKLLNLQVIDQAYRWRKLGALYTSIAVLDPKRTRYQKFNWYSDFVDKALRESGIGLILLERRTFKIIEAIKPSLQRYNYQKSKLIINDLDDRMKPYLPGSSSKDGYSPPGQRTIENALQFIHERRVCTLDDILLNINTHFRIRAKARKFLIAKLCNHPRLDYRLNGYAITFTIKP